MEEALSLQQWELNSCFLLFLWLMTSEMIIPNVFPVNFLHAFNLSLNDPLRKIHPRTLPHNMSSLITKELRLLSCGVGEDSRVLAHRCN